MEKFFSKIVGTPILCDDNLRPVASVRDIVIDPENGKVLGLFTDLRQKKIISAIDILSWGDYVKINDLSAIIDANNIMRVEQIINSDRKIFRNNVETKGGEYIGKVVDFSINLKTMELNTIYVTKEFLGLVRFSSRIIKAKDIIEVLSDKIIVKDGLALVKIKETVNLERVGA